MKTLLLLFALLAPLIGADLTSVPVSNRTHPLTNTKVIKVTVNGITFLSDQGLVQVPFANLPPEFAAQYKAEAVVQTAPVAPTPPRPVKVVQSAPPKSPLQLAREAKDRAERASSLRAQIAEDESLVSRYDRQSLIGNKNPISFETYNVSKARIDESKAKLAELETK